MPIIVSSVISFLDTVIKPDPEDGIDLKEIYVLHREWISRRGGQRAQAVVFYALVELYCRMKRPDIQCESTPTNRLIRGYSYSSPDMRRLSSIYSKGTGSSVQNQETVTRLFKPLMEVEIL